MKALEGGSVIPSDYCYRRCNLDYRIFLFSILSLPKIDLDSFARNAGYQWEQKTELAQTQQSRHEGPFGRGSAEPTEIATCRET